jgi:hypothetical protein
MSNLLGDEIKIPAYREISFEDLKSSFRFFCLTEKKATSEPEKKTESNNKTINKITWYNQSISTKIQILRNEKN